MKTSKKLRMRKCVSLLIMVIIWSSISAQNERWEDISFEEYLQEVHSFDQRISPTDSYSFNTTYSFFKNYVETNPIEIIEGESICRNGKDFMVDQSTYVTLQDTEMGLKIDKDEKTIYLIDLDTNFYVQSNFESYTNQIKKDVIKGIQRKKIEPNETHYQIVFQPGIDYSAMELVFNSKIGLFKIVIFSNQISPDTTDGNEEGEKLRVEIEIKNFRKNKEANLAQLLLLSDVVTRENGAWKGKGNYNEYRIVDLRN